jgi:hypothetical protein
MNKKQHMCTSGDRFCFLGFATFVCYPICKEEKLEVIFALFYFVVSLSGGAFLGFGIFGKHSPVNSRMRFSFMRWGRELTCERVGPWISIRPTSRPIPPPLQGAALPLGCPSCGCELSIGIWMEEEGRRKGRIQGEFVIIFCVYVLQLN